MSDPLNLVGKTIDHFFVESFIAQGGMAAVYAARDQRLKRLVALKVILPHQAKNKAAIARFQREAQTVARLSHPHIIPIYHSGNLPTGEPYLVMEFVRAGTLHDQLANYQTHGQHLTPVAVLQQMRKIIEALAVMHRANIVHRDLKPANILLRDEQTPLLADMGIASVGDAATKLTRTGVRLGTPAYMSPEQARGEELDGRSDLYTVGVMLYEMLGRQRPFTAQTPLDYLHHHMHTPPRPLKEINSALTTATCQLVDRCLQKEPSSRYQTAEELLTAVDRAIHAEQQSPSFAPFTLPTIKEVEIYQTATKPTAVWWQQPRTLIPAVAALILVALLALFALRGNNTDDPSVADGENSGAETAVSTPTFTTIPFTATPEPTSTLLPTPAQAEATLAPPTPSPEPATAPTAKPIILTIALPITPSPTPSNRLTATCQQSAGDRWGSTLYPANSDKLGCPLNQPHTTLSAYQIYERGLMVWREDTDWVYILFNNGTYNNYDSKIAEEGYYDTPERKGAFGYIWNTTESVRNRIGNPQGAEAHATDFVVQDFANGLIFYFLENQANNYVLITNTATWHAQQE